MAELKAFFESFGLRNVLTYIQSGNIIFDAREKPPASFLEEKIQQRFNTKNMAVFIKTPQEIAGVIRQNPFKDIPDFNVKKLYIHYLQHIPDKERAKELASLSFEGEFFCLQNDVIYVYYGTSRGRARLSNAFFEKKLGVAATARNWNTTSKLLSLATAG